MAIFSQGRFWFNRISVLIHMEYSTLKQWGYFMRFGNAYMVVNAYKCTKVNIGLEKQVGYAIFNLLFKIIVFSFQFNIQYHYVTFNN